MSTRSHGIEVKVEFYARIRDRLGAAERDLQLENPSFETFLSKISEALGEASDILIDNEGKLRETLMLSINYELVGSFELARLKLKDRDRVAIMPLPSGG